MNVTLAVAQMPSPRASRIRAGLPRLLPAGLGLLLACTSLGGGSETHNGLQAVKADGTSAWTGTPPFTLQGVLLNDPEEFLDSTPRFVPWNDGTFGYELFLQEIIVHDPPRLRISVISWPASAPDYRLHFADGMSGQSWQPVTTSPVRENGWLTVREQAMDAAARFYRLEAVR